ncbi:MAG: T9SS type A sorting domain-containing protein, partial [Ignavibacteriaceae bacterium]
NNALLDSSEIFKETIDTVDFGEVKVFNIVGHNNWTIGKNKVTVGPPPLYWTTIEDERNLNGDYTVPVRSAELINNQVFEHTYYIPNIQHSALPSGQPTLEILLGIFSDPPVIYFPQYADPPPSYALVTNVKNDLEILNSFYLSQNFPNPFNPITTIRYRLPVSGKVTLKLYDVLGNEIANLVNEEKSVGVYEITFYAGNLPSGAYFYQLRTEKFVETKKMILMK